MIFDVKIATRDKTKSNSVTLPDVARPEPEMDDPPAESNRGYASAFAAQRMIRPAEFCGTREFRERATERTEEAIGNQGQLG